jgi:hypothetical protein
MSFVAKFAQAAPNATSTYPACTTAPSVIAVTGAGTAPLLLAHRAR